MVVPGADYIAIAALIVTVVGIFLEIHLHNKRKKYEIETLKELKKIQENRPSNPETNKVGNLEEFIIGIVLGAVFAFIIAILLTLD